MTNKWIFGSYIQELSSIYSEDEIPNGDWDDVTACIYEVDSSTVGQCTGLRDKNAVPIYEGDLLIACYDDKPGIVIMKNAQWQLEYEDGCYLLYGSCPHEIIGNIHENPELLEG